MEMLMKKKSPVEPAPHRDRLLVILRCFHRVQRELLAGADELLASAALSADSGDFLEAISELNVVHAYLTLYAQTDIGTLRQFDPAACPFESLPFEEEADERRRSWGIDQRPTDSEAEQIWKRYDATYRFLKSEAPKPPPAFAGFGGRLEP
jgi:hypothetical protein